LNLNLRYGKIQHFNWFNRDQNIIGCANSGIVTIWNAFSGQRLYEYIEKTIKFKSVFLNGHLMEYSIFAFDYHNNLTILKNNNSSRMRSSVSSVSLTLDQNNLEDLVLEKVVYFANLIKDSSGMIEKRMPLKITCFNVFENWIILGTNKGIIYFYDYVLNDLLTTIYDNKNENGPCLSISQLLVIKLNDDKANLICFYENGLTKIFVFSHESIDYKTDNLILTKQPLFNKISDDILIYKKDLKQKISNDFNLKNLLEEQQDEQKYQLKLKDVINNEEIRTINYQAKVKFTYLRNFIKKKKFIKDQNLKTSRIRLNEIKEKFHRDLNQLKETNEAILISKYILLDQLNNDLDKLKKQNESLVTNINNISLDPNYELNLNLENNLEKNLKFETNILNSNANAELEKLKNLIKYITCNNYELELENDNLIENLKHNLNCDYNNYLKQNEQLKYDISICKYNIESLNEILENKNESK
jgi:hypothetical protein